MYYPILVLDGEARYEELLREAERERRARKPGVDLLTLLALLGLGVR
jgi:hypothetical protein